MEESEKRRERLRSMRQEAAAASGGASGGGGGVPQQQTLTNNNNQLSNPLVDYQAPPPPAAPPRFDYYTDPLSAYSSHKPNHSHPSPSPPPPPPPPLGSTPFRVGNTGPCYSPYPTNSPSEFRNPFPVQQAHPGLGRGSGSGSGNTPYPPHHQGTPTTFTSPPYRGPPPVLGRGSTPYPPHQGSSNFMPPPRGWTPRPNLNPNPNPGLGYAGSPSPSYGRGRGEWNGGGRINPGSRYSGGRGRGRAFDAQPRSYFDRSMIEDPWESLTPVIWQPVQTTFSAKVHQGPVTMSFAAKKPRVSNTFEKPSNEPSLAEFLAAASDAAEAEGDET